MKKKVSVSIDEELLEQIDKERGLATVSAYMNNIIKEKLKK